RRRGDRRVALRALLPLRTLGGRANSSAHGPRRDTPARSRGAGGPVGAPRDAEGGAPGEHPGGAGSAERVPDDLAPGQLGYADGSAAPERRRAHVALPFHRYGPEGALADDPIATEMLSFVPL